MKLLLTCLLFIITTSLFAQEDVTDSIENAMEALKEDYNPVSIEPEALRSETQYQSEKLSVKKFNKDEWKKIVGETNFDEKPIEKRKVSAPLMQASPWAGPVLKILAYVMVIVIVVLVIYFLIRNASTGPVKAKEGVSSYSFITPEDDIETFDMEDMIRKARGAGNLNLVVRAYYLGLLKKLHKGGMIQWKKDKTNFDYLIELLARNTYYDEVKKLTLAYEVVWYGERIVSSDTYEQIIRDFEQMHRQLAILESK